MKIVGTQGTIPTSAIASYVLTKTSAADMKVTMMSEVRLIDANALRKQFEDRTLEDFTCYHFIAAIDNAPTVEQEVFISAGDYNVFLEGYKQGKKDFARPRGEWIMQLHNCDGEFYTCSVCGRMIRVSPYVEDNETLKDFPYCHCGAEMRGKENDK